MNRGAEKLRKKLVKHGAKAELARGIGAAPYQISHWLRGERKPDTLQRAWIEDHMGVGWRLWDEEFDPQKPPGKAA